LEPAELDLQSFGRTHKGQIIRAVLEGFSSRHTIETGRRFSARQWTQILTLFYRLAGYLSPPIYPSYTNELLGEPDDPEESIRLVNLVYDAEPLVVKQKITLTKLNDWTNGLQAQAQELTNEGDRFEMRDDPDEYDDWESRSRRFLATAAGFARWSHADPVEEVTALRGRLEEVRRPYEREPEDHDVEALPASGHYWTLQRLFEDL
jgi:hypothetical protein